MDLVITNPPYVRYQDQVSHSVYCLPDRDEIRHGLIQCLMRSHNLTDSDRRIFLECAKGYSGLADMAFPCWILAASRVAIGADLRLWFEYMAIP